MILSRLYSPILCKGRLERVTATVNVERSENSKWMTTMNNPKNEPPDAMQIETEILQITQSSEITHTHTHTHTHTRKNVSNPFFNFNILELCTFRRSLISNCNLRDAAFILNHSFIQPIYILLYLSILQESFSSALEAFFLNN